MQYAQQRGITVIPEIDIPGHCYAAIQALPELSESVQKVGAPRSVQGWDIVETRFRCRCFFVFNRFFLFSKKICKKKFGKKKKVSVATC